MFYYPKSSGAGILQYDQMRQNNNDIYRDYDQNRNRNDYLNTMPRVNPRTTPRTTPSTTPVTTPSPGPGATPITTPRTTPVTTPGTTPGTTPVTRPAGPGATPITTPNTTPVTTPNTTPRMTPGTTPSNGSNYNIENNPNRNLNNIMNDINHDAEMSEEEAFREALALIRDAVEDERSDALFYNDLMQMAPDQQQMDIIATIRDDEIRHNQYFRDIYRDFTGEEIRTNQNNSYERPENYLSGIEAAMFGELGAVERYRIILEGMPDQYYRDILFEIITDELKHGNKYNYLFTKNYR